MTQFTSKKWILFVSRPGSLLRREFRKDCYLYADNISNLKVSQILVIGKKGINLTFLKKNEDRKNYLQIKNDYKNKKTEEVFSNFKKIIISNSKTIRKISLIKTIKNIQTIGPIPFYSHYLERVLTQENQRFNQLGRLEKDRLKNLIQQNSELLNKTIKIMDRYYELDYKYFRQKHPNKNVDYYQIDELVKNKKIRKEEIKSRENFFTQLINKDRTKIYIKQRAVDILKREKFTQKKINSSSHRLKGSVAYPGKIIGKVTIIKKVSDFKKFSKNEIIVSPMTLIYFTPYLRNVKAIITDEGGISCHAAITAREFKIPCIVGTKIATQVLRDGDLVEVNADKGVVKILKRK